MMTLVVLPFSTAGTGSTILGIGAISTLQYFVLAVLLAFFLHPRIVRRPRVACVAFSTLVIVLQLATLVQHSSNGELNKLAAVAAICAATAAICSSAIFLVWDRLKPL